MTLIEVLGGLTLLGILAASVITVQARHTRQHRSAALLQQAVAEADALLNDWWTQQEPLATPAQGQITHHSNMTWRRDVVRQIDILGHNVDVVRFEVLDDTTPGQPRVITYTELLVPSSVVATGPAS